MRYLIPILLLLASCRTTKNTQTTRVVTDSTTERALREYVQILEEEIRSGSKDSAIKYVTDIVFEECDSAAPATVIFDDGRITSITGQLRSIKQQLSEEASERYYQSYRADSLQEVVDSMRTTKRIEYVEKVKEVERRYIPIWVWFAMGLLGVALIRAYWPGLVDWLRPGR